MRSHLLRVGALLAIACGLLLAADQPARSQEKGKGKKDQVINPNGEPKGFKAGETERYAVWFGKKGWHLRTTTAKVEHRFHGKIHVEAGTFDGVESFHLEGTGKLEDHWRLSENRKEIVFDFKTDKGVDGITFQLSQEAREVVFNLHIDGKHKAKRIFIGYENHHPTTDPFAFPANPK
jgi:hypothetical protein